MLKVRWFFIVASILSACQVEGSPNLECPTGGVQSNSFKSIFDSLQAKFPGRTRTEISDVICAAKERIDTTTTAQKTLLQIAREINASVPTEAIGAILLEETAAAYVTLVRRFGE
jgi:hypothetical protein